MFGSRLGIYHSKFPDAERVEIWQKQLSVETIYIIRCSDGWMGCTSEGYEMAVQLAQEHIEGTDLTYVII